MIKRRNICKSNGRLSIWLKMFQEDGGNTWAENDFLFNYFLPFFFFFLNDLLSWARPPNDRIFPAIKPPSVSFNQSKPGGDRGGDGSSTRRGKKGRPEVFLPIPADNNSNRREVLGLSLFFPSDDLMSKTLDILSLLEISPKSLMSWSIDWWGIADQSPTRL